MTDNYYARTSISLPSALKKRMDAITESVNWSAIAAKAFEAHLKELELRKENKEMAEVIERLRLQRQQQESETFQQGFETGKSWATRKANFSQLQNLEALYNRLSNEPTYDWQWYFNPEDGSNAYSVEEYLFFEIEPRFDGERGAASDFWEEFWGDEYRSMNKIDGNWLRGFGEGALSIWNAVKERI